MGYVKTEFEKTENNKADNDKIDNNKIENEQIGNDQLGNNHQIDNNQIKNNQIESGVLDEQIMGAEAADKKLTPMTTEISSASINEEIQISKKDISVKSILYVLGGAILCWFMLVRAAR